MVSTTVFFTILLLPHIKRIYKITIDNDSPPTPAAGPSRWPSSADGNEVALCFRCSLNLRRAHPGQKSHSGEGAPPLQPQSDRRNGTLSNLTGPRRNQILGIVFANPQSKLWIARAVTRLSRSSPKLRLSNSIGCLRPVLRLIHRLDAHKIEKRPRVVVRILFHPTGEFVI